MSCAPLFFAHLQVWSILFFQLLLCSIRRRGSSDILIKIRDTSLWKFVPFSRQAECQNFACVMTQAVLAMVVFDTPKGCVGVWKTIVLVQREQARLRIDKINSDDIKREI